MTARSELERGREACRNETWQHAFELLGQADAQGYKLASGRKRAVAALEINPHYGPAHVLMADLNISDEKFKDALDAAKKAVGMRPSRVKKSGSK